MVKMSRSYIDNIIIIIKVALIDWLRVAVPCTYGGRIVWLSHIYIYSQGLNWPQAIRA